MGNRFSSKHFTGEGFGLPPGSHSGYFAYLKRTLEQQQDVPHETDIHQHTQKDLGELAVQEAIAETEVANGKEK